MLSFASALLQAITAVLIVGVAAVLIGATAKAMGDTVRVIETVSYALIVLVGARLFWVKGRAFLRTLHALEPNSLPVEQDAAHDRAAHHGHAACCHHNHAHHHHEPRRSHRRRHGSHHHEHGGHHAHDHDHEENVLPWGHAHGPEPEELAGPGRLAARALGDRRGRLATVLGRDHRSRLRAGAGTVLGRRRLHVRDGDRHCHHGRRNRLACGRRKSRGEAVRGDARRATAR